MLHHEWVGCYEKLWRYGSIIDSDTINGTEALDIYIMLMDEHPKTLHIPRERSMTCSWDGDHKARTPSSIRWSFKAAPAVHILE